MSDYKIKIGNKIKEIRISLNLSQEDLAELCGLHRTYIGSVERGERNISLENIVRIAHALSVKPFILLEALD